MHFELKNAVEIHVAYKHFKLHKIGFGNRYKLQNNFAKGNCHFLSFVDMFALFCEQFIFVAYVSKHGSKSSLLSLFIVENVERSSLMKSFVIRTFWPSKYEAFHISRKISRGFLNNVIFLPCFCRERSN